MKTFLLALPLAALALFAAATPASANSDPPFPIVAHSHHHHHYVVLYRTCSHDPWQFYGSFDCPIQAAAAARHLVHRGYQTFVKHPHHH